MIWEEGQMKKILSLLSVALFLAFCAAQTAEAAVISYTTAQDALKEDRWYNTYRVFNDSTTDYIDAFTIYFDYGLYDGLDVVVYPSGWDSAFWDPGITFGVEEPGEVVIWAYGAGIAPGESLPGIVVVGFDWLAGGTPGGNQAFNILDPDNDYLPFEDRGGWASFDAGEPGAPVPEPGTLALLGTGVVGLAAYCRRMRKAGKR
jgi:hypothetical protein